MLRLILALFVLSSCSLGILKSGGERTYIYDIHSEYQSEDLKSLSKQVVTTLRRDPPVGKLEDLFSKKQKPLRRIGIAVFETSIQETRSGLSGNNLVYLSSQGKQLITEKLLTMWEQSLPILAPDLNYITAAKIKKSKSFQKYGFNVEDHIKSNRVALAPDDIFFLPPGKKVTTDTILNPRGMRDLSLALVPASELIHGPKFSEHAKHALNDLAKELKLDALIIIMSEISWTASHIDKHSGDIIPEEIVLNITADTIVPLSEYRKRLEALGQKGELPNVSIAYRSYETEIQVPVLLSVPDEMHNFETIQNELLSPLFKAYKDLSQMVMFRMVEDLRATH